MAAIIQERSHEDKDRWQSQVEKAVYLHTFSEENLMSLDARDQKERSINVDAEVSVWRD